MTSITAEYDGRVFVPSQPIDLPAGTRVVIPVPSPPRRPTASEDIEWKNILDEIAASPPAFPTVEDALSASRRRS